MTKLKDNLKLDTTDLLSGLKELKSVLANINRFSAEQNTYFSKKNQNIDLRMKLNNTKSLQYLKKKDSVPNIPQNELLDILSEHIQIHHLKFVLVQEFIEDVYTRLDNIGQSINKSLTPLIQYLESQDNDQDNN